MITLRSLMKKTKGTNVLSTFGCIVAFCFSANLMAAGDGFPNNATQLLRWQEGKATQVLQLPAYRLEQQMQVALADCMAAAGFTYQPFIPSDMFPGLLAQQTKSKSLVDVLVDRTPTYSANPNDAVLRTMSDKEQAKYLQQLWDRETGCATWAYRETYDKVLSVVGNQRADAFEQALNAISKQTNRHPQVKAALSHWSTCATEATGIALSDPSDIEAIIQDDLNRSVTTAGGLPLEAVLHAKYDAKAVIPDGVFAAALESARSIENTLKGATQSCDTALDKTIDDVTTELTKRTFNRYKDLIDILMQWGHNS